MRMTHLILAATFGLLLAGCKTEGVKPETGGDTDPADTDVETDTDTDADTDADTDTDTNVDTDTDVDPECWIESESGLCFDCELPTAPEGNSDKFLNQCTDADFAAFDNATRIPSSTWVPGTDLPPVP
jgi:hypothetical protein